MFNPENRSICLRGADNTNIIIAIITPLIQECCLSCGLPNSTVLTLSRSSGSARRAFWMPSILLDVDGLLPPYGLRIDLNNQHGTFPAPDMDPHPQEHSHSLNAPHCFDIVPSFLASRYLCCDSRIYPEYLHSPFEIRNCNVDSGEIISRCYGCSHRVKDHDRLR